jgi:hypothetical protein
MHLTDLTRCVRHHNMPIERIAMWAGLPAAAALAACAKGFLRVQAIAPCMTRLPVVASADAGDGSGGAEASVDAQAEGEATCSVSRDSTKYPSSSNVRPKVKKQSSTAASADVGQTGNDTLQEAVQRLLSRLDRQIATVKTVMLLPPAGCVIAEQVLLSCSACKGWTLQSLHDSLVRQRSLYAMGEGFTLCDVQHALADEQVLTLLEHFGSALAAKLQSLKGG